MAWRFLPFHPLLVRTSVHRTAALHLLPKLLCQPDKDLNQQDERPDPAQAKSNTSGKARTTVQAQTAYTMR